MINFEARRHFPSISRLSIVYRCGGTRLGSLSCLDTLLTLLTLLTPVYFPMTLPQQPLWAGHTGHTSSHQSDHIPANQPFPVRMSQQYNLHSLHTLHIMLALICMSPSKRQNNCIKWPGEKDRDNREGKVSKEIL